MLIVTQAGKIVNLDRVERVSVESDCVAKSGDYKVVALGGSGKYTTMGWYRTKERAEDVVKEIVENYETPFQVKAYKMP